MKTSVVNYVNRQNQKGEELNIPDICASFQEAVADVLVEKTGRDFNGHYKMGCSSGIVEDWVEGYYQVETVTVPADAADGVESATTLMSLRPSCSTTDSSAPRWTNGA